jgi:spermidine/putrescine transport system permease protein
MTSKVLSFSRKIVLFFRRPKVDKVVKTGGSVLKWTFFVSVIFMLYFPIIIIALQSFNNSQSMYDFTTFTFKWYGLIFSERSLSQAILNSLLVAVLATAISTILGTIFAIGIHSLTKKKRQKMVLLNQVPILNADIVTGISLMLVFKVLMMVFPTIFGLTTMLLAHVFFCLPYVILSVLPKLSELDPNLYDAALDLGCKPAKGIVRVILPAISSGIFTGMLMAFTMSIDDFVISYFNTGQGFENVSIWIYASIGRQMSPSVYAYNTAFSFLMILVLVVISVRGSIKKRRSITKFNHI